MIAIAKCKYRVDDLMHQQAVDLDDMVGSTGIDVEVLRAIAEQRYTPSAEQRDRVASFFGVRRENIIWGHRNPAQQYIHDPL